VAEQAGAFGEVEGGAAGERGEDGGDEAGPEVAGGPGDGGSLGEPGQGEEEETGEELVGRDGVGFGDQALGDGADQAVGGPVEERADEGQGELDEEEEEAPGDEAQGRRERVVGGHLVVAQAQRLEEAVVGLDRAGGGGDLLRVVLLEPLVALEQGEVEGEGLGQVVGTREVDVAVGEQLGGAGEAAGLLPGVVVG